MKNKNKFSESFIIDQGVRQGRVLSPLLLFNIFLADLPEVLNQDQCKIKLKNTNLSCLIWADDIVLLSESENGRT